MTHKSDREEAKSAMAKATAMREKEAAAFAKESSEDKANLESLTKALAAIEKGMSGGFLQTTAAAQLRRLTLNQDITNHDREALTAFLSQGQGDSLEYAPASGGSQKGVRRANGSQAEGDRYPHSSDRE